MPLPTDLINEMQHLVLRTHFINPVYLPTLTESFLAKDFDFGEYLALILSKAVNEHLKIHFVTMLSALPLLVAFFLFLSTESSAFYIESLDVTLESTFVMHVVLLCAFLLTIGMFFLARFELDSIQAVLFPQILLNEDSVGRQDDDGVLAQCGGTPPPLVQPEALNLH